MPLSMSEEQVVTIHQLIFQLQSSPLPPKLSGDEAYPESQNVATTPYLQNYSSGTPPDKMGICSNFSSAQNSEPEPPPLPEENNPCLVLFKRLTSNSQLNSSCFSNSPHRRVQSALLHSIPQLLGDPFNPLTQQISDFASKYASKYFQQ